MIPDNVMYQPQKEREENPVFGLSRFLRSFAVNLTVD